MEVSWGVQCIKLGFLKADFVMEIVYAGIIGIAFSGQTVAREAK